jgi:hypothetical protein
MWSINPISSPQPRRESLIHVEILLKCTLRSPSSWIGLNWLSVECCPSVWPKPASYRVPLFGCGAKVALCFGSDPLGGLVRHTRPQNVPGIERCIPPPPSQGPILEFDTGDSKGIAEETRRDQRCIRDLVLSTSVIWRMLTGNCHRLLPPFLFSSICLSIYGSTALLLGFALLSSDSWSFYTVGRTPWTGDQPVARPLHAHRTTQTQK